MGKDIWMHIRKLISNGKDSKIDQAIEVKYDELQSRFEQQTAQYDELKAQYDEDLVRKECVICLDKMRTHCCVPCGHKCLCDECEGIDGKCPICQTKYYSLIRVYDGKLNAK